MNGDKSNNSALVVFRALLLLGCRLVDILKTTQKMSDGDSNDKENATVLSSSPQHLVPESNGKLSEANSKETKMAVDDEGDGDTPSSPKDTSSCDDSAKAAAAASSAPLGEPIDVKVVWNKTKYDVVVRPEETVLDLKTKMHELTQLPPTMQKIMFKGLCKDDRTMKDLKVSKGTKIMLVGSTLDDVLSVSTTPKAADLKDSSGSAVSAAKKEPLSKQKPHLKVTEKGPPEDVIPGLPNVKESLPPQPLSGMLNKSGGKVRLTFKLENDEVWIGTKERTDKVPMSSIKAVVSEPIDGHLGFHMVALQLGPTEASRYWIYWVPSQYVDAIKRTILG